VVLSSRERPFLVEPMGSGLRGVTLRFAHEVRGEADYFSDIPQMKLPTEMMKLTRACAHSAQEAGEASRSSNCGEAFSGERRQLNGWAPPKHRGRAPGRKGLIPAKRRKTRGQTGSARP
jgi:hypothetical protein